MPPRNLPPLEAAILPDTRPRKSWVPLIMGTILVGSCLLAVVIGIWGLVKLVESLDRPGTFAGVSGSDTWQSTADKQAEYRASFKVPVDVSQSADVLQVEKLLAKYITAARYNDAGGLARLVDVNAFLQRMEDHPDMPWLDTTARKALVVQLNQRLQLPEDVLDIRLMGFKRLSPEGLGVADVVFKQVKGTSEPCRIWLQQRERSWSVVDWEFIQMGRSQAADWAGAWRASHDYIDSTAHREFLDDLAKAEDRYRQGDIPGAISFVQSADQRSVPDYLHKESKLHVAWLYLRCRQYQLAIDCLQTSGESDEVPGVYVIRALCYQPLGQGELAIAAADAYERRCGFSPDVVRAKALALAHLERKEEAIIEFKRLLAFDPSDEVARKAHDEIQMANGE